MRTQERINSMNDIIVGIARRSAYKFKTLSAEELAQELWVKILEKEEKVGHDLDLDLIAHICYDTIVDLQRYCMRRNYISLDDLLLRGIPGDESENKRKDNDYEINKVFGTKVDDTDNLNRILIEDLLKVFPEGSKEKFFLEYYCTATGYKDFGINGHGKNCEGYTESDLAEQLGFPGTGSYAFKRFRREMREFIREFLELD